MSGGVLSHKEPAMYKYRIKDWDKNFETAQSRKVDKFHWVAVPNKQHGLGFVRICTLEDGAAIYGIWSMLLGACSQQRKPRDGWMTADGTKKGAPWTISDLAEKWRRTEAEIARALDVLTSPKIGWVEVIETNVGGFAQKHPSSAQTSPSPAQSSPATYKTDSTDIQDRQNTGGGKPPLHGQVFVCAGGSTWSPTLAQVSAWETAYPSTDIPGTFQKMAVWLESNEAKRKTPKGMPRFINAWLSREHDKWKGQTTLAEADPFAALEPSPEALALAAEIYPTGAI